MRTIALEACPVCGAEAAEPVDLGGGAHRRCGACGTVRTERFGDPHEVFVDGYFEAGGDSGVDTQHPRMQRALADIGARRLARLRQAIGGGPAGTTLLDVGTGSGEFPAVAAQAGWDVLGVDPMPAAVTRARARGLDVHLGTTADPEIAGRTFDVVSALHVLEHMPDSRAFLSELKGLVRPGGHIVVEVPNLGSELQARTLSGWIHLRPLEHLVQFEPPTLRRALESGGLEVVAMSTPSWVLPQHTLDEALGALGRPTWSRFLAPVSPTRDVAGTEARAKVPGAIARAAIRATDHRYERTLRGMVILAVAKVPPA